MASRKRKGVWRGEVDNVPKKVDWLATGFLEMCDSDDREKRHCVFSNLAPSPVIGQTWRFLLDAAVLRYWVFNLSLRRLNSEG